VGHLLPQGEGTKRIFLLPEGEGGRRPDEGEIVDEGQQCCKIHHCPLTLALSLRERGQKISLLPQGRRWPKAG